MMQAKEIGLELMERGGLVTMVGGAGAIISCVLGLIVESRLMAFVMGAGALAGIVGFLLGLVVWGSGWMLKQE